MTTAELNALKTRLLSRNFSSLDALTARAEEILVNAIIAEATALELDDDDKLMGSRGNVVTMSQAIERAFNKFRKGDQVKILQNILKSFSSIGSLNETYFRAAAEDKARYDKLIDDVEKEMRERIGVTARGSLVPNGFLYNLVNDTTLAATIQQQSQQAIVSSMSFKDYLKMLQVTIGGTPDLSGIITSHYQTFVHDAYSAYDSVYANKVALDLELRFAIYQGGLIETSRKICIKHNGKTYSREEIYEKFPNDPDLPKTREERESGVLNYDPIRDKGRWRCRHHWNWITLPEGARGLRKDSKESGPELDALGKSMAERFDGDVSKLSLKSEASIVRKARDDYGGYYNQIKDGARNTVIVPGDQIDDAIAYIKKDPRVVKVKRQLSTDDFLGYSGNIINLKLSNGVVVEMQLNTAKMLYAKDDSARSILGEEVFNEIRRITGQPPARGHHFYEEYRKLDKNNPADARKMAEIEKASREYYSHFY